MEGGNMKEFLATVFAAIIVIIAEILLLPIYIIFLPCTILEWTENRKYEKWRRERR